MEKSFQEIQERMRECEDKISRCQEVLINLQISLLLIVGLGVIIGVSAIAAFVSTP